MIAYQDPSMFSGRRGAALTAVALLHIVVGSAFYVGLAQPIIEHITLPVIIDNIAKPRAKVLVQPAEPKFEQLKLRYDEPEVVAVAADSQTQVAIEPTHLDPPVTVEREAPVKDAFVVGARMDPKHPIRVGPDFYPSAAIRSGQEGRCVVEVAVAADGRVTNSSLRASSGFPLLDDACLSAVRGQRMMPATRDGRAIESNVSLPIVWKLAELR